MEELISVIIPIYKVEAYLNRCIRSVVSQSYRNLEIILVDDGSPDQCGKMCEEFAASDSRIRVLHKENGGLSDARNYGTERANGKYIAFIDSDDYIAPNYMEYLHNLIVENNADIAVCCMVKTEGDTAEFGADNSMPPVQVLTGRESCQKLFGRLYMVLVTAWGKLYKREIVNKYPFPKGRNHEDEATTCKYYFDSDKVAVGNHRLYAYYQNPNSITHTQGAKLNEDMIWALEHKAQFFEDNNELEIAKLAWANYFYYCLEDSLQYHGRCDQYIKKMIGHRCLSARVKLESHIYDFSHGLYGICRSIAAVLRKVIKRS